MAKLLDIHNTKQPPIDAPKLLPDATQTSQDNSKFAPKFLNKDKIKEYRLRGNTMEEIGKLMNCHHSSISKALLNIVFTNEELNEAKKALPSLILNDYLVARKYITPDKLKKASAIELSKITSFKYREYKEEVGEQPITLDKCVFNIVGNVTMAPPVMAPDNHNPSIIDITPVDKPDPSNTE